MSTSFWRCRWRGACWCGLCPLRARSLTDLGWACHRWSQKELLVDRTVSKRRSTGSSVVILHHHHHRQPAGGRLLQNPDAAPFRGRTVAALAAARPTIPQRARSPLGNGANDLPSGRPLTGSTAFAALTSAAPPPIDNHLFAD